LFRWYGRFCFSTPGLVCGEHGSMLAENSCDDAVSRQSGDQQAYAELLVLS
jgi:hypothetical protein